MKAKLLFVVVPAAFFILGDGAAIAGQTIDKVGVIACVTDKWTETELEKGHKLAELGSTLCAHSERSRRGERHPGLRGKV